MWNSSMANTATTFLRQKRRLLRTSVSAIASGQQRYWQARWLGGGVSQSIVWVTQAHTTGSTTRPMSFILRWQPQYPPFSSFVKGIRFRKIWGTGPALFIISIHTEMGRLDTVLKPC